MDPFIRLARERLQADDVALARRLGVSLGCLRNWGRRGAPAYGKLALAALIAGIDPDQIFEPVQSRRPLPIAAE
jgi:DNA-binding transcriptional regulator YiaG